MSSDRRAILALIAMGRITPEQAERLLAAWNESRETAWILAASFGFAVLAQFRAQEIWPMLRHLVSAEVPALMHMLGVFLGVMGGLL
jgi:fructose-bisphosphate aldolase class 1